jgi:sugar phosphate isomerase/epimerase
MLEKTRFCVLGNTWNPHYDRFLTNDERHKPSVTEAIRLAAGVNGLEGIELVHPAQVWPDNLEEVRACLKETGLVAASIAASISSKPQFRGGSLTSDDPNTRREAIDTIKTAMDLAYELNAERINVWLGRDGFDAPFQIDYDLAWNRIVEAFQEISTHRPDIKVGIEYKIKEPRKWLLVSTAAKTALLAQEVGRPNIGALLDTGHALWVYENLAEVIVMLARQKRLFHIHFNDNTRMWDDDMVIGSVHFLEIMEMLYWLDRVGYEGWLSFDPHANLEDPSRCVVESLRYVRGMIKVLENIGKDAIEEAIATRQVTEIMALVGDQIFKDL